MSFFDGAGLLIPWINVIADHGADPTGGSDSTTAFNAAIAVANATGRTIYIPPGIYIIGSSLSAITREGVVIKGGGTWNTFISSTFSSGDIFTFAASYCTIESLAIQSSTFRTSGYAIVFSSANYCIARHVYMQFECNGIRVLSSSECIIENVQIRYTTGNIGIMYEGTSGAPSTGLRIKDFLGANPYIRGQYNQFLKTWNPSTAYTVTTNVGSDLFIVNGWIWQVDVAGTSGSSAPAAPTTTSWFDTNVTNGTMQVRATQKSDLIWIVMDNYARNMTILECALLNGFTGIKMQDSSGLNTLTSVPQGLIAYDIEIDHPWGAGMDLQRGYGVNLTSAWIGSVFTGNGFQVDSNFIGGISLSACRIAACGQHGVLFNGVRDFKIHKTYAFLNGVNSSTVGGPFYYAPGTFHDIVIADPSSISSNGFTVATTSCGNQSIDLSKYTGHGMFIGTSCNNFSIVGNMTRSGAHTSIFINNGAGTSAYKVVANNAGP